LERVAGNCLSDEVFAWHAANLTSLRGEGKEWFLDNYAFCTYIGPRKPGGLPSTACRIDSPRRRQLEWLQGR
jgi:hypothetical protein